MSVFDDEIHHAIIDRKLFPSILQMILGAGMFVSGIVISSETIKYYNKRQEGDVKLIKMVDYKLLREKLDEKRYDEITEEEQVVLNEVLSAILDALEPLFEQLAHQYAALLKFAELIF